MQCVTIYTGNVLHLFRHIFGPHHNFNNLIYLSKVVENPQGQYHDEKNRCAVADDKESGDHSCESPGPDAYCKRYINIHSVDFS